MKRWPALLILPLIRAPYADDPTHRIMTEYAVDLAAQVPGYQELLKFKSTLVDAAVKEDVTPRFNQHFYDPTTGKGMPINSYTTLFFEQSMPDLSRGTRFMSALEWARNGMPDHKDWEGAIKAYGDLQRSREQAYEALGHVVHLLQDMAQPDHASSRPHPGNYAREKTAKINKKLADYLFPADRVGYETLWAQPGLTWDLGKTIRKPPTMTQAFNDVAAKSQSAEKARGLLHQPWEIALGLEKVAVDNALLMVSTPMGNGRTFGQELASSHRQWAFQQYAKFKDNLWMKYELEVALLPAIPWPPQQATAPYIELGKEMLPLAEEYSAGLMQLFHDIVNPPPFVKSVKIIQEGRVKYHKRWRNSEAGGRQLHVEADEPLKKNVEAEVQVEFGPDQEPVTDVHVFLDPPNGQGIEIALSYLGAPPVYSGKFTPQIGGTLRITAKDQHRHLEGRTPLGDELDSNPAAPAHATVVDVDKYGWEGYEPGPDRNHRVRLQGECRIAEFSAETLKALAAGTYSGTVSYHNEDASSGRVINTKIQVTFRCLLNRPPWQKDGFIGGWDMGHGVGSFDSRWRWYKDKPEESRSGTDVRVNMFLRYQASQDAEPGHEYSGHVDTPTLQGSLLPPIVRGKACDEGNLMGKIEQNGSITTWDLRFTPCEPPEFVTLCDLRDPHLIGSDLSRYSKSAWEALTPAIGKLAAANRQADIKAIQDAMTEPLNAFSRDAKAHSEFLGRFTEAYKEARDEWLTHEPHPIEARYEQKLQVVRSVVAEWKRRRATLEASLAAATDRAAALIKDVDADGAAQLNQLAERLRKEGSAAFGESNH